MLQNTLRLLSFFALLTIVQSADANPVFARRGKITGSVNISGGPANAVGRIEQSVEPGSNEYVDTGFEITTDASGSGKTSIPNVSSGTLLCGHRVRVVFPGGQRCGPTRVNYVSANFAAVRPGLNPGLAVAVAQVVQDDKDTLLETWDSGAEWTLRLNAAQAQWIPGNVTLSSDEGDLAMTLLEASGTDIRFRIDSDATPFTPNTIRISGVDLMVESDVALLDMQYGLLGSTSAYLNGELLGTERYNLPTFVQATSVAVVPGPGALVTALLGAIPGFYCLLRRRRA
jgi:hypothetical protein